YTRYSARQYLQIRVRDLKQLGPLLDATADAGADQVEGPDFGFADPSAGRLLATRAALADARRRADDAAATAGLRITGVRSVVLAPDSSDNGYDEAASGGGSESNSVQAVSSPTNISAGTQQFRERVRVVYTAAPV
ncbi:MAG: SIMPL domain-containing protein, partial [Solirubrobacteraceae bacterium]